MVLKFVGLDALLQGMNIDKEMMGEQSPGALQHFDVKEMRRD